MFHKLKRLLPIFSILPFLIGSYGYFIAGEEMTNAFYASFALYFVNPISDYYNYYIEGARWGAAFVTTTAIFYALRNVGRSFSWLVKSFGNDSVAIYASEDLTIEFPEAKRNVMYSKEGKFILGADSHIIMYGTDEENFRFFEENKKKLKGKKVYIGLSDLNYGLLKELGSETEKRAGDIDVTFYDINGVIARDLWKNKIHLWTDFGIKNQAKIVIFGCSDLGKSILNYGLTLNLMSLEQKIDYYFIGNYEQYALTHEGMNLFNQDKIHYLKEEDASVWEIVKEADIVILSEERTVDFLEAVGVLNKGKVYYYSRKKGIKEYLDFKATIVLPFGMDEDVYKDENIRAGKLMEKAIDGHYSYLQKTKNEGTVLLGRLAEWNKLDGFFKWSNISSADFTDVIRYLYEKGVQTEIETLAELEHIRWCRFLGINYWKYGETADGKKDSVNKIHPCLIPYSKLSGENKDKDMDVVLRSISMK